MVVDRCSAEEIDGLVYYICTWKEEFVQFGFDLGN
jgi:hypothetical protein